MGFCPIKKAQTLFLEVLNFNIAQSNRGSKGRVMCSRGEDYVYHLVPVHVENNSR